MLLNFFFTFRFFASFSIRKYFKTREDVKRAHSTLLREDVNPLEAGKRGREE